ncbi:MAG: hypothetical protein J5634_03760 [Bacilli bacterium]|nr:hypothetical protein [Bacilli bacterium]
MNLISMLDEELKNKHLSKNETLRYIYLRVCEIFSFDPRWFYTVVWSNHDLLKSINEKVLDVENIDDTKVICHNVSRYILKPLIEEFTGFDCEPISNYDHTHLIVKTNKGSRDLDPVFGDFSRVKVNIETKDYEGISRHELQLIDKSLGYNLKNENNLISTYEKLEPVENLMKFQRLLNKEKLDCYSDIRYLFTTLARIDKMFYETYLNKEYDFKKLIRVFGINKYYIIEKDSNYYKLRESNKKEFDIYERNDIYRSRFIK